MARSDPEKKFKKLSLFYQVSALILLVQRRIKISLKKFNCLKIHFFPRNTRTSSLYVEPLFFLHLLSATLFEFCNDASINWQRLLP